jgi:arsenate reductase (thioredoxin)
MIKPKVLFLCTADRCHTQIAEAFLRDLAGDRFDVSSAGYEEAPEICPDAIAVMREVDIDISGQHPKKADQFLRERFSYVITLRTREIEPSCPIFPGASWRLTWPVENPATVESDSEPRAITRRVRDEIQPYVVEFVKENG